MNNKEIAICVVAAFFCAIVWMALPMSVFEENNPGVSAVLKILGTVAGAGAIGYMPINTLNNDPYTYHIHHCKYIPGAA